MLVLGSAALAFASPAAAFERVHPSAGAVLSQPAATAQPTPSPAPVSAAAAPAPQPADDFKTELGFRSSAFRGHVAFLADDLLEGRDPGTRGFDLAAHYVASQLQGLGLRPANNGSWFQQVPLARTSQSGGGMAIGSRRFANGVDLVYADGPPAEPFDFEAPVAFVGHAVIDAAANRDDLAGLDLAGKILVIMESRGRPPVPAVMAAAQRGAVGAIIIRLPAGQTAMDAPIAQLAQQMAGGVKLDAPAGGAASPLGGLRFAALADRPLLEALFANAQRPLAPVERDLQSNRPFRGFALGSVRADRTITMQRFSSPNVVAMIPGSDPALANEYVLLSAHLDGLGVDEPSTEPAAAGAQTDRIRNGAMDNATGVATLLEVARHFMLPGNQPRRPIILAAVTAEEVGLLGSRYLARNPVVQGTVVANVNLDMPILTYAFRDVVAFGAEHSSLGPIVERAARAMNVVVIPDPLPEERLFTRSDHYSFVQAGVPAVFLMTGFGGEGAARFRGFLANEYHSPRDDLNLPFDWRSGARFAELNYRIAREIANADTAPRWYPGTPFTPQGAQTTPRPAN
jgi:hypothetical protein